MSFGKILIFGWLLGLVIVASCVVRNRREKQSASDVFLACVLVLVPVIAATGAWMLFQTGPRLALSDSGPEVFEPGTLYETHVASGRPSLGVYMKGFGDMSFSACLLKPDGPSLIFSELPYLSVRVDNPGARKSAARRIPARPDSPKMYDVFWSADSNRFALAAKGYLIDAYDLKTRQKVETSPSNALDYQYRSMDALIGRFLNGEKVTAAEVQELKQKAYAQAAQAYEQTKSNRN